MYRSSRPSRELVAVRAPGDGSRTGRRVFTWAEGVEQDDERTESRRYMSMVILGACRDADQPDMGNIMLMRAELVIEVIAIAV